MNEHRHEAIGRVRSPEPEDIEQAMVYARRLRSEAFFDVADWLRSTAGSLLSRLREEMTRHRIEDAGPGSPVPPAASGAR